MDMISDPGSKRTPIVCDTTGFGLKPTIVGGERAQELSTTAPLGEAWWNVEAAADLGDCSQRPPKECPGERLGLNVDSVDSLRRSPLILRDERRRGGGNVLGQHTVRERL